MSFNLSKLLIDDETYSKYLEDIKKYYLLKNKYDLIKTNAKNKIIKDDNSMEIKKKLYAQEKIKCINCKQIGGTIFTETNQMLKAVCGNIETPCKLNMEIIKFKSIYIDNELEKSHKLLLDTKNKIILTKLNYLFKYVEEDRAIELFDELKNELQLHNDKYNEFLVLYNSIVDDEEKKTLINNILTNQNDLIIEVKYLMKLYKETDDFNYLKEAVNKYINDIKDLDKSLQDLKYKYNNIELDDELSYKLIQDKYNINHMELIIKPN